MITNIEHYQKLLQTLIAETAKEAATTRDSRAVVTLDQQSVGRLSRMDALQQQAMANATYARRQAQSTRALAALKRIEDGEFGICLDCGEDIAPKRLDYDPTLPLCITCANG